MILETILTTTDADGRVNCAPMGVEWGEEDVIIIKPFKETTTFRNLLACNTAVVNLTDNVLLFAKGAIERSIFSVRPAVVVAGAVLQDVCSWREVQVESIDTRQPRVRITTRVMHCGFQREFLGFNRARYAVLEAAILATRTWLLPREHILSEFERLQIIVDKTAGANEFEAMKLLTRYVYATLKLS